MSKQTNWAHWIVIQTKHGVSVSFGPPGDAKTAIHKLAAKVFGRDYVQFFLSGQTPEDQGGVPYPSDVTIGGVKRKCLVPLFSETYLRARYTDCFVHLDEMNHASREVFGAIQEPWLNQLPEKAFVCATANPVDMATDGIELPPAVINRCCLLTWEDYDEEYDEGLRTGTFPDPQIPVLPDSWVDYKLKWENILLAFKQQNLHHFDREETYPKSESEVGKPWRSKRSWHNFIVNLAACEAVGANQSVANAVGNGFVGEGPTAEFFSWLERQAYPAASEIYDDPKVLKLPRRFDLARGIVKSVLAYAKTKSAEEPGVAFEKGQDFVEHIYAQNKEIGMGIRPLFLELKPNDYVPAERNSGSYLEMRKEVLGSRG